jgi:hypothetical protein
MKRALSIVLALAVIAAYQLPLLVAAAQNTGEISGTAVVEGKPLSNVGVRLRNVDNGQIVATSRTNQRGEFRFTAIPVGNYVVEIIDDRDGAAALLGTSVRIPLTPGAMVASNVTVTTSAAAAGAAGAAAGAGAAGASGAAAGAAAGAGGFFTSTLGIVTIAAIGAGVTAGAVAATGNASPSR